MSVLVQAAYERYLEAKEVYRREILERQKRCPHTRVMETEMGSMRMCEDCYYEERASSFPGALRGYFPDPFGTMRLPTTHTETKLNTKYVKRVALDVFISGRAPI